MHRLIPPCVGFVLLTVGVLSDVGAQSPAEKAQANRLFDRNQLVAWCIVPFDGKQRGPAERAQMLKRLGLRRVAYDWREKHVATFEEEILQYRQHGLEYFAFWDTHPQAFRLFEKYKLHPQIWKMLSQPAGQTQAARVRSAAEQILPLVRQTRKMGSKLGLYNHGGWSGEPENLVAVCQYLREHHRAEHVGIVYNQHHAHARIDEFAKILALMKPYLLCLNLNGMSRNGERSGKKILPLGEGELDVSLMKILRDSGYRGPVGIIGHTQDDVEQRLADNLDGLDWILPQLDGKPPGPKPPLRTWSPEEDAPDNGPDIEGAMLEGQAAYRAPPLTIECRVTLSDRSRYNILVASDTKASAAHWEIFTVTGSGLFTAYLPGMEPDHVRSRAMLCDGQPHTVTMLYEPDRVRLLVDGKTVADQTVRSRRRTVVPGGLAIGRLVRERLGCSGPIDWVRISRGIRAVADDPLLDVQQDGSTLLLWRARKPRSPTGKGGSQSGHSIPGHSAAAVARFVTNSRQRGVAQRGLRVFSSAESACLSCHKITRHGGSVGPDLTQLGRQRKPAEIIESVVWPQRHVEPAYRARMIFTADGRAYRGYVLRRNAHQLILRDPTQPAAEPVTIDVDQIEAEREIGTLMPENLIASLSDTERNDLFCFLLGLGCADGIPPQQLDGLLAHAHGHRSASFAVPRKPLQPDDWPSWRHSVNRDRVYDFYAKQADYFRRQPNGPTLLQDYPGLDGGQLGHWGNQDDEYWSSPRWNDTLLGSVQCGIFRGAGVTVPRGVCVKLDEDGLHSACFNPDTLSYDAVWTGGFLKFSSFRHGFLDGLLLDGSPAARPEGSRPPAPFRYRGFYRDGNRVVFAYRVGAVEYLDSPSSQDGRFTRRVAPAKEHPSFARISEPPRRPPRVFETPIELGSAAPYAIDTIGLPTKNPWNAQIFVGGLNFLSDGSAMICTMHGDVWRVEGYQFPSRVARWTRFASGLHHLLGMVIDDDGIFVLGRDQITRLHDFNDDGRADFYECFCNAYVTSPAGHDFTCGLQRDPQGYFYTASGSQGLLRISPDGKRAEILATGFRNPDGCGLLPDGTLTVPCSEGDWTPASMICRVHPGEQTEPSFHGAGGPRQGQLPALPLAYLPRGVDNSSGGQTVVNSDRWGPLEGQLIHFSFGAGAHMLVLRDELAGQWQGAVVPLPGEFRSGVHRGRFHPTDGQLYVGGMQGWGTYTTDDGCFQRVRYTGGAVQLPVGFRVHENGIAVRFSEPLDAGIATDATNHFAQCWNYRYSAAYGSPEFSTKHTGVRGHDRLAISGAHIGDDARTLFLEIPELQPVNQLHLRVRSGAARDHELFVTVHRLADPYTAIPGYQSTDKTIAPHPIVADLAMATRSIPNPHRQPLERARQVTVTTGSNLSYQTRIVRAQAGEPLALTLANPDVVPHNWALAKPGTLRRVGQLANRLVSDPEAVLRHYVPRTSDVLAYTDVVFPGESFTIYFHAPEQPGRYPFLCTFPGHWLIMNGTLLVERRSRTR
ncbi:MAG: heme-binding domain-containing protein [Planctomycetaceae bacterium]|nr:heme-binding domain-containing protein [Planctomycetaceae bacterium]